MTNPPNEKKVFENSDKSSPFFQKLLQNLNWYLDTKDMSLREFSERTGITFETVRSIVYHKTNTCRLETAVAIAKELGMTVDKLIDSGLVNPITQESLELTKDFTTTELELVRWYIRKTARRHQKYPGKKMVTIMSPICYDGALKATNDYSAINVSKFPPAVSQTAFFGLIIPCEHYMPHYVQGQTILLSSDRKPRINEHCVINVDNNVYIASYYEENGKPKFKSIINKRPLSVDITLDDVVGYISHIVEE